MASRPVPLRIMKAKVTAGLNWAPVSRLAHAKQTKSTTGIVALEVAPLKYASGKTVGLREAMMP